MYFTKNPVREYNTCAYICIYIHSTGNTIRECNTYLARPLGECNNSIYIYLYIDITTRLTPSGNKGYIHTCIYVYIYIYILRRKTKKKKKKQEIQETYIYIYIYTLQKGTPQGIHEMFVYIYFPGVPLREYKKC